MALTLPILLGLMLLVQLSAPACECVLSLCALLLVLVSMSVVYLWRGPVQLPMEVRLVMLRMPLTWHQVVTGCCLRRLPTPAC